MEIVARSEAKKLGLKHYFTGNECKNNHLDMRHVTNGRCFQCARQDCKKFRETHQVEVKAYTEKHKKQAKLYRETHKDKMREHKRKWKKKNRNKLNADLVLYRAKKIKAFPKWANKKLIEEIYKNCPKGYEVDHIVPLRGKLVSGLHVENNLQYLTPTENATKGNRHET